MSSKFLCRLGKTEIMSWGVTLNKKAYPHTLITEKMLIVNPRIDDNK
jgi:hypothetical protein